MARIVTFIALILAAFTGLARADEPRTLERIVVTPSRLDASSKNNAKSLTILDSAAFSGSAYSAVTDLIGNAGGIDIRRRGPEGVQADVAIRGTTFEQNSVLIDGVRINDPQTGHYTMDLPVTLADIDRIEILKGPASSLYGANSFGGAINIITKKAREEKAVIRVEGGSYDYFDGAVSVSCPFGGIFANRFSIEESRSTGYMPETEFNILSLTDTVSAETPLGNYDFMFGYSKKDYGADSFYSNLYSNEEEHTDTRFFKLSGEAEDGDLKIMPKLFLRRHRDKFSLDRNRPGWQTNYHTTYDYGMDLSFKLENDFADTAYGVEVSRDRIDSTNIQTHKLDRQGVYFEIQPKLADNLYLNISFREDHFSNFGWQYSPSMSASYVLFDAFKVRSSIGRAYRIPTFTELYYGDAANIGNSDLKPESCWSYEAGCDYGVEALNASLTFFHRDSFDTIDWIRNSARDRWRAENIGTVDTNGIESSLEFFPKKVFKELPLERAFLLYTALDNYRKHDYLSKYALDYLKQHISAGLDIDFYGIKNSWVLNYKKRVGDSGYLTADMKISKGIFNIEKFSLEAYLSVENLFDVKYSEQSDIPMPGRWIKSGASIRF